jgi:acyl-CoA thioesterase-2
VSDDEDLSATRMALDDLLRRLQLEPIGDDRFQVAAAEEHFSDRIYGGNLLAQALVAAGRTVEDKDVQSLHAAFVKAGTPGRPVEVEVARVRDGRSMATRQVTVVQDGHALLVAFASFYCGSRDPVVAPPPPQVPGPERTPLLQEWARPAGDLGRHWIDRPPAVELRLPEAPSFLGGTGRSQLRSHWMRLPRQVDAGQLVHTALLAYASDFFLMDMLFRVHPGPLGPGQAQGFSVDHAIWFHCPARFDDWHVYTQEAVTLAGDRGLARGSIHDHAGRLVATVMQEVLVRPVSAQ